MTAQLGETLVYEGREVYICSEPLGGYFALGGYEPEFQVRSTALWRGYVGTWELIDNRLYIIGLEGTLKDGSDATLETVFPGYPDRAFAHWYSGMLRIPEGKMLKYVHMGYASKYERDLLIKIENGVVVDTQVRENGVVDANGGREGIRIRAMTVFPLLSREGKDDQ